MISLVMLIAMLGGVGAGQSRDNLSYTWVASLPACTKPNWGMLMGVTDLIDPKYGEKAMGLGNIRGTVYCAKDKWVVLDVEKPEPLKCGKYQHVEPGHVEQGSDFHFVLYGERCIDDVHMVTEKEWQELERDRKEMREHIKTLERSICVGKQSDILFRCK